jgi:hypothetical protein
MNRNASRPSGRLFHGWRLSENSAMVGDIRTVSMNCSAPLPCSDHHHRPGHASGDASAQAQTLRIEQAAAMARFLRQAQVAAIQPLPGSVRQQP